MVRLHASLFMLFAATACTPSGKPNAGVSATDAAAEDNGGTTGETTGETTGDTTTDGTAGGTTGETTGGTTGETTGGTTGTIETGQVALGFPEDLVVVSPYSTETAALAQEANTEVAAIKTGNVAVLNLDDDKPLVPKFTQDEARGFAAKRAFLTSLVRNVASDDGCMFKPDKPRKREALCYGPQLFYQNHPDGPPGSNGQLPPNDLGFWLASEPIADTSPVKFEPCMTAKTSEIVDEISRHVDNATGTAAMFLCFARRGGKSLPEAGQTLDLQPFADKAKAKLPDDAPDFTDVTMKREDVAGTPVYTTSFKLTEKFTDVPSGKSNHVVEIHIVHKPTGDNNSSYTGYVDVLVGPTTVPATTPTNLRVCPGSPGPVMNQVRDAGLRAMSVTYKKVEETAISYEYRGGSFPYDTDKATLFDASGYARIPTGSDCELGGELALYDLNPATGAAKLAYSWFAGSPDEAVRSLVSEVEIDETTTPFTKKGCGYFGFGANMNDIMAQRNDTDVAHPLVDGKLTQQLTRFTCNWAGPSGTVGSGAFVDDVQMQCGKQDNDTGYFEVDAAKPDHIRYSPQTACQYTPTGNPATEFKICVGAANDMSCKNTGDPFVFKGPPLTSDLVDISTLTNGEVYSPPVFTP